MELVLEKEKSEDLRALVKFLGSNVNVSISEATPSSPFELPLLKIGGDSIRGTKTIALYLSSFSPKLLGVQSIEKAEVEQWLTFCNTTIKPAIATKNQKATKEFARVLNEILVQRVYFCTNYLTVADLIIFANLYSYMDNLNRKQRFEVCNLSRWYDLLQHTENVDLGKNLIAIDLDENVAPVPAKVEKKGKEEAQPKQEESEKKSEKKEKEKEKPKEKAAPEASEQKGEDDVDVSKLNLKVGKILEVKKHDGADSLYVEQIDCGEDKPRTVVSGLVKFMTMEEMQGRHVILVANMKPAAMRGVTSEAMVLCANAPDGSKVEFVDPPAGSQPGDRVFVEGYETGTPEAVLNPKKKIFEKIQPDFKTSEEKVATYRGKAFKTSKGLCTVKSIVGGPIK